MAGRVRLRANVAAMVCLTGGGHSRLEPQPCRGAERGFRPVHHAARTLAIRPWTGKSVSFPPGAGGVTFALTNPKAKCPNDGKARCAKCIRRGRAVPAGGRGPARAARSWRTATGISMRGGARRRPDRRRHPRENTAARVRSRPVAAASAPAPAMSAPCRVRPEQGVHPAVAGFPAGVFRCPTGSAASPSRTSVSSSGRQRARRPA